MDAQTEDVPGAPPPKPLASWYTQGLSDGLGDRLLMFDNSESPSLELLRFHPHLAQVPGFEDALREQVQRLAQFQHPAFARVRSVQRLEPDDDLALVSNYTPGKRLSEILHRARGPAFAAALIRQLAPALAQFQQHAAGTSHGVLDPDRIVVSPEGRLTIVEHVVGRAIETLGAPQLSSAGVALPPGDDGAPSRVDASTDWYQLGLVAASVLLGRAVTPADMPEVGRLLDELDASAEPDGTQLSLFIRQWLGGSLQISGECADVGAGEAPMPVASLPSSLAPEKVEVARRPATRPSAPPNRTRSTTNTRHESTVEVHRPAASKPRHAPPPQARVPDPLSMFERETLAGKSSLLEFRQGGVVQESPTLSVRTPVRSDEPRTFSFKIVAALAALAIFEGGVIGWMARARWSAPEPAIVSHTTPSGEKLLTKPSISRRESLDMVVAPDLSWARVTSRLANAAAIKATDPGTLEIFAPIELKVFEGSRLIGSVPGDGIRLSPGRHEIAVVNTALGYRLTQSLDLEAGQTVSFHLVQPQGTVTIDASPWAEVSIDGRAVGRTPLGPLALSLGEHEIAFRHPAGSVDRQQVRVKPEGVTRVVGILRFN